MKVSVFSFFIVLFLGVALVIFRPSPKAQNATISINPAPAASESAIITPMPTASPSPTLTASQMNQLYGPCTTAPTLMYHHLQPADLAKSKNQASLTVNPEIFEKHLQYIKDKGYQPISMAQLAAFFDSKTPLPSKPILITFDDGYQDNYDYAIPLLSKFSYPATIFISTGLMENPDYMTWSEIVNSPKSILFANHTWSHKNVATNLETIDKEIGTADTQLTERGRNQPKVFAYPYGSNNGNDLKVLNKYNYSLAFTTKPGSYLCAKKRLELPRIRTGNAPLSSFGL